MARVMSKLATAAILAGEVLASCETNTGLTQMVTYVKRHPNYTRAEFWEYWETQHAPKVVPLAAHFNISRYQQVQVGGKIPPTAAGSDESPSNNLVDFDGIAMFLYRSSDDLTAMLAHPYYLEIVEPDERKFIDKDAFGGGMVATYIGNHIEAVDNGDDVWEGDRAAHQTYQDIFKSYLQGEI